MRNLVVLSDGTGNSADALSKTNVWRLYEALDLTGSNQIATFGDGVGTSKSKPLRMLGLALGIGVKKNTIQLYKFLCRNFEDDDRIWCFGFSRGAFTVRTLAGLINHEGLVSFKNDEELDRNAIAAYRAYRRKAFPTKLPWVVAGRWLRDFAVRLWNRSIGARTYETIRAETIARKRHIIPIEFLGVWDTVVAYGLPVDELTQAVDKWVWPMTFRDKSLLVNVKCARHALSIDDERRTFFPLVWDEVDERAMLEQDPSLPGDRLLQVWFAGVHANVGGGYPDDSLSFIPLCWMIEEASLKGLLFREEIVALQAGLATAAGRLYDSRSGFGMFYRYQPRDVSALMGGQRPVIHHSVVKRMALGADGYAPISLQYDLDVLPPYGPLIPFSGPGAASQLPFAADGTAGLPAAPANPRKVPSASILDLRESKKEVLEQIIKLDATDARSPIVDLVQDTVWWRRATYFVSLGLALTILIYPLIGSSIHFPGQKPSDNWVRTIVQMVLTPVNQFLPGYSEPWITAIEDHGFVPAIVLTLFAGTLGFSRILQRRIVDRSRAAWRVQTRADGEVLDRLRLTDQSRAGLLGMIVFSLLALLSCAERADVRLIWAFAGLAAASFILFLQRKVFPEARPMLAIARGLRTSKLVLAVYRWLARVLLPAVFLAVCVAIVLALTHHIAAALISNTGYFCVDSSELVSVDTGDKSFVFDTKSLCQKTGIVVSEGQRYRVTIDIPDDDDWFDQSIWTDVRGFPTGRLRHYLALPLRRWWTKNWFQPILRVGRTGNFEYALEPLHPLRNVPLQSCEARQESDSRVYDPASLAIRQEVKRCGGKPLVPARKLVAEFTPRTEGEVFVYVNDAMLLWPDGTERFYNNNSGTAQVTIAPVLAPAIISR